MVDRRFDASEIFAFRPKLDKASLYGYLAAMLRKAVAAILVLFWVALSGLAIAQDFGVPSVSKPALQVTRCADSEDLHDLLQNVEHRICSTAIFIPLSVASRVDERSDSKLTKLHKLNSIFLI